jgi:3-hydroxymyristoyl/3-hydroxydecanoyl-(acyl carrier protein) dehydratase
MKYPNITKYKKISEKDIIVHLHILKEIMYFNGHFDSLSVLPGVVQVDWAMYYAEKYFNISKNEYSRIESIKFSKIITPGLVVLLQLIFDDKAESIRFNYYSDNNCVYSVGNIKKGS